MCIMLWRRSFFMFLTQAFRYHAFQACYWFYVYLPFCNCWFIYLCEFKDGFKITGSNFPGIQFSFSEDCFRVRRSKQWPSSSFFPQILKKTGIQHVKWEKKRSLGCSFTGKGNTEDLKTPKFISPFLFKHLGFISLYKFSELH